MILTCPGPLGYRFPVFFRDSGEEQLRRLCEDAIKPGCTVLDIGGGLRVLKDRGNRFDPNRARWATPLLAQTRYRILDPIDSYKPDIVGDIHCLPLPDASEDVALCFSVLEHVEDPCLAMRELHRVLRPGGLLLLHVPFLFPYHAQPGYYGDFWRFSDEGVKRLGKDFRSCEVTALYGRFLAAVLVSHLARYRSIQELAKVLDSVAQNRLGKRTLQVTGYFARLER